MKPPKSEAIEPTVYTVSQLSRETKELLNQHFLTIQVEGEISNLSTPSSGHIYFTLKDAKAQVRCAMFRFRQKKMGFIPENGQQVVVSAQVSLYEPRGDFQLIVQTIEEAGDGALLRAFETLKLKLDNEGLFDPDSKKQLPYLPQTIGIITSPTGAAIKDILNVLDRRFAAVPVILYPVAVQGDAAKHEIVKALEIAHSRKECDIIILSRGGGSLEDLWSFNEEIVARAIYACSIPIISGIGHEIDFTIADFVADIRAPTPSAAAEHCTPVAQELLQYFKQLENQLNQQLKRKLTHSQQTLNWLNKRLFQQHPGQQLTTKTQKLDNLELRLNQILQTKLSKKQTGLELISNRLWQLSPANKTRAYQMQQQYLSGRLITSLNRKLERLKQQLNNTSQTLDAVSPLATLNRGYAIVSNAQSEQIIRATKQLKKGDSIQTQLAQGHFVSKIEEINHD
jgi:exodeoxyribonuclease VII large subunit